MKHPALAPHGLQVACLASLQGPAKLLNVGSLLECRPKTGLALGALLMHKNREYSRLKPDWFSENLDLTNMNLADHQVDKEMIPTFRSDPKAYPGLQSPAYMSDFV